MDKMELVSVENWRQYLENLQKTRRVLDSLETSPPRAPHKQVPLNQVPKAVIPTWPVPMCHVANAATWRNMSRDSVALQTVREHASDACIDLYCGGLLPRKATGSKKFVVQTKARTYHSEILFWLKCTASFRDLVNDTEMSVGNKLGSMRESYASEVAVKHLAHTATEDVVVVVVGIWQQDSHARDLHCRTDALESVQPRPQRTYSLRV